MERLMKQNQAVASLKKRVEIAYADIGLSPSSRMSRGFDDTYVRRKAKQSESYAFLVHLSNFTNELSFSERQVLFYDILEPGYHYEFWHLQFYSPREYRAVQRSLSKKILEEFPA